MEGDRELPIGTLIKDMDKIGVITRVIKSGALKTDHPLIKWRVNYEIFYSDGSIAVIGRVAFDRLMETGAIQIF